MEYFNLLEFNKEPFSNSPEPEFLFTAPQYNACLQRLELAVRLRRGLNIVIGAVGTGKTTLCRKLIQVLSAADAGGATAVETFLLLDPAVESRLEFARTVASVLGVASVAEDDNEWQIKEKIKTFLFEQGVRNQKNITLVIDEGQKIPGDCLEILREFLNYETNSFKLLQIIIFAQPEFRKNLAARANLLDRVNYLCNLKPLSFRQTKAMIEHRIAVASQDPSRPPLFTLGGMLAVYTHSGGYPRKIISLCHQVLLMLIIRGKRQAGWWLVQNCAGEANRRPFWRVSRAAPVALLLAVGLIAGYVYWNHPEKIHRIILNPLVLSGISLKNDAPMSSQSAAGVSLQKTKSTPELSAAVSKAEQLQNTEKQHDLSNTSGQSEKENQKVTKIPEKMPDYLGEIVVKRKMTIWRILENVYGDTSKDMASRLLAANPQVKNQDHVSSGSIIKLPTVAEKTRLLRQNDIIVALEQSRELENIYYSFIEKRDLASMPPIRFVALWNKRDGRQFVIALSGRFADTDEAQTAIRRLPPDLAGRARVLSKWESDTIYFNAMF